MTSLRTGILLALIVCVGLAAYLPGRTGGFVFDDHLNIVENRSLHIATLDRESLARAASSSITGGFGRPLSMLSFGINHAFTGLDPTAFKLTNIGIHLIAVILVFFLAREIFAALRDTARPSPSQDRAGLYALGVAAIFALHPMQLTSVLYIVQRMTSLAGVFTLAGVLGYVVARRQMWNGKGGFPALIFVPAICAVLATLAKENGVLLPMFALTIESVVFRFRTATGVLDRRVLAWHGFLVFVPAVVGIIWLMIDPLRFLHTYAVRDYTLGERLLTEARVLVFYIQNIIAPSIGQLGLYHDDIQISRGLFDPAFTLPAIGFLTGLLGIAWYLRDRLPLISLGIVWFFAGHVLESTILPLEIAHEHRNYLPLFGFALIAAGLAFRLESPSVPRWLPQTALVAFISLLTFTTWVRATQWANPVDYAETEIRHHPESSRATYEAGRIYGILVDEGHKEFLPRAIELLDHAATLDANTTLPLAGAIFAAHKWGMPVNAGWIEQLKERYATRPYGPSSNHTIKVLMRRTLKVQCLSDSQIVAILDAATSNPSLEKYPDFRADLATVYGEYLMNGRGDVAGAERKFHESIAAVPTVGQYRVNLINLLLATGRPDDAERELRSLRELRRSKVSAPRLALLEGDITNLRGYLARSPASIK